MIGLLEAGCDNNPEDLKPEIALGDLDQMVVNHYDTTLTGVYHEQKILELDIDNDGTDDLQITNEIWGSPGLGQHPYSTIRCLHQEIQLAGIHTYDTSFLNHEVWIGDEPGFQVEVWEYYNYTCHRISEADSILSIIPVFEISTFHRDEILHSGDQFQADTATLYNDPFAYPPEMWESGDTLFRRSIVYANDCYLFPADQATYIGLKMTDSHRLGWIRLGMFSCYKVLVLESAVQAVY
ncbi:MAG: hypothetical protein V2B15_15950 [Bacteroidota bacterium]